MHVIRKERRQRQGAARAQDIDLPRGRDRVRRLIEILMGGLFHGPPDDVDILVEYRVEDIVVPDAVGRNLHALDRGKLVPDHLLHGLLQLRISCVTDLRGKTHYGRFAHANRSTQAGSCHKRHLVIMLQYIFCNQSLAFRKTGHFVLNSGGQQVIHFKSHLRAVYFIGFAARSHAENDGNLHKSCKK